jgi:hypothetical protein
MTFEEIQRTLEQMLAIQRDLQEKHLQMLDAVSRLIEVSNRHERRIEQLIGYSLTNESDHLNLEEKFRALEQRVQRLESTN